MNLCIHFNLQGANMNLTLIFILFSYAQAQEIGTTEQEPVTGSVGMSITEMSTKFCQNDAEVTLKNFETSMGNNVSSELRREVREMELKDCAMGFQIGMGEIKASLKRGITNPNKLIANAKLACRTRFPSKNNETDEEYIARISRTNGCVFGSAHALYLNLMFDSKMNRNSNLSEPNKKIKKN